MDLTLASKVIEGVETLCGISMLTAAELMDGSSVGFVPISQSVVDMNLSA